MKILFMTNIPSPTRVKFFGEMSQYCDLTVLYELHNSRERNREWMNGLKKSESYKEICLTPVWRSTASTWCPAVTKYLKRGMWDMVIVGVTALLQACMLFSV